MKDLISFDDLVVDAENKLLIVWKDNNTRLRHIIGELKIAYR